MTFELNMATLLYVATCIGVLGTAIKLLYSAKKALLKPLDDINRKIKEHEVFLNNDKKQLEKTNRALADMTDSINMLIKSHRTVLYHLQEGNHNGEIRAEIEELDNWLIESRGKFDG